MHAQAQTFLVAQCPFQSSDKSTTSNLPLRAFPRAHIRKLIEISCDLICA